MGPVLSSIKGFKKEEKQKDSRYQTYRPLIHVIRIQIQVEATNIPETYFECGKLEIKFEQQIPYTNDLQNKVAIRLRSSECNVFRDCFFENPWRKDIMIEFRLMNTDKLWETTIESQWFRMGQKTTTHKVEFPCGPTFEVTIRLVLPDCQYLDSTKLCQEESTFVINRKAVVFKRIQKMFTIEQLDDVPNIAIIGSGGGLRAVIGMSAAMTELKANGITDYTMYTAGLSGSAWYLLALYAKDKFDPKNVATNIRQSLQNFKGTKCVIVWNILKQYGKYLLDSAGGKPTFTNVFGELIAKILNKEESNKKWSAQSLSLERGEVPLPLIAALHVRNKETSYDHNEWIELSPYQVFIPRYGTGIKMKNFGKQFYGGYCTGKYEEKSVAFLQGMCGSAYTKVRDLRPSGNTEYTLRSVMKRLVWFLFDLFDGIFVAKVPNILFGIQRFQVHPEDKGIKHAGGLPVLLGYGLWLSALLISSEIVLKDLKHPDALIDVEKKNMMLVDAGIVINSPYPTILRPSRKVDLILSFDFSERDDDMKSPFGELLQSEKWAKARHVKFPEIAAKINQIEEERGEGQYEETYIFESDGAPTIMHFVMVNKSFRTTENFDIFPAYDTLKFNYTMAEFDKLYNLVRHNVQENNKKITECIQKAILKKTT